MKTGVELIAEERKRQIEVEGWTAEHDEEHSRGELATAGVCYALGKRSIRKEFGNPEWAFVKVNIDLWLWEDKWWKLSISSPLGPDTQDRIRNLVKAGALIAAEIDRLEALSRQTAQVKQ